ncbi:MAG TPA: zinc-dependent metalloprotease, partial [Candidatus Baltobacteraceae bacterium]
MLRIGHVAFCGILALAAAGAASAAPKPATPAKPAASAAGAPAAFDTWIEGRTAQHGLFTIWRKDGEVGIELKPAQLDRDFVELGVPINGIGEGLFSGITDLQNCRIMRFTRQDDKVAILFPSTRFLANPGTPEQRAVDAGTAPTVVGVAKILSEDKATGDIVIDAAPFLQDVTDVADALTDLNGGHALNPTGTYRLDSQSTYFGKTKAFPDNVVLVANQTFSTQNGQYIDVTPDARNLQIAMQYNIAELPRDDSYRPRIYDDRVGYFVNAHADFSSDNSYNKDLNYIVRWNLQPSDPAKALSPAKNPIVWYLSDTIPMQYRQPVRDALLTWNRAFEKIGISNAVVVKDQPNDPNFDPDDIRYNVIRWLAERQGGFAEAQLLYNPYTGEMIKSGVVVDSDLMRGGKFDYPVLVQPQVATAAADPAAARYAARRNDMREFLTGEHEQYQYGATALSILTGDGYTVPAKFSNDFLKSIVLHESGHDFGLRHNFIGSQAYTAKQLQSLAFTSKYGNATSVMEYAPINIWPKGTPAGTYFQTVLGPYDYYVIHWGYARIPGAKTPAAEVPTLRGWASAWSNPRDSWSSDEDVAWGGGRGIDPRNQQWDLTSDNIGWCQTQMKMSHDLIGNVGRHFPRAGTSYQDLQVAFGTLARHYGLCGVIVSRYLGGEYVSRARRGDPHAAPPLQAIPIATQRRAYKLLEQYVYGPEAWNYSPALLQHMV